jgi:hypothetical protein
VSALPDRYPATISPEELLGMPIWKVTELGSLALQDRVQAHMAVSGLEGDAQTAWAFNAAIELHEGQTRTNGPYIDHPMRVADYCMSLGVNDSDTVSAALLHDTVEDQSRRIIERYGGGTVPVTNDPNINMSHAFIAYEQTGKLSPETIDCLRRVTVPDFRPYLTHFFDEKLIRVVKNTLYLGRLTNFIINHPRAVVVKWADLGDNGVNNHHTIGEDKKIKSDIKYYPIWDILAKAIQREESLVTDSDVLTKSLAEFRAGKQRAEARMRKARVTREAMSLTTILQAG